MSSREPRRTSAVGDCRTWWPNSSPGEASDRDYREKREEYWTDGIREYWIVDPALRRVLVLLRQGEAWVERSYQGEDVIASELLPAFAGSVAEVWADVDDED